MSERTRRPPTDSSSETLTRQDHEFSVDAPVLDGLAQRASALETSPPITPQAETAERMRNSPLVSAQRKTRDLMVNSAGATSLRKTAQGMQDSTVQRLSAALPEATMADTMAASAVSQMTTTTTVSDPNPEPSTVTATTLAPIQRVLKIDDPDNQHGDLFTLLGGSAGLTFNWDDKTQIVTITEEADGKIASPALRTYLKTVINDAGKTAQVILKVHQDDNIGAWGKWQRLDVPRLTTIEASLPGIGAAMAIHEIWENYQGQDAGGPGKMGQYEPAHQQAKVAESAVAAEISGRPGNRVADATDGDTWFAFDYRNYYLVLNMDDKTVVRTDRTAVGTHQLTNYADTAVAHGAADTAVVAAAKAQLDANPLATAKITGYRRGTEAAALSAQRANAVWTELSALIGFQEADTDDDEEEGAAAPAAAAAVAVPAPPANSERCFVHDGAAVAGAAGAGTAFVTIEITKPQGNFDAEVEAEGDDDDAPAAADAVAAEAAPAEAGAAQDAAAAR